MVYKFLTKQIDLNKVIKLIERIVLKGTQLLMTIKDGWAGYLNIT